jgi:hypothetical protein
MRFSFLLLLLALPLLTYSQQVSQQKLDSLKIDTLLSAFRHDFVERQFLYLNDRIEKLDKKVEDMEEARSQDKYWIGGFIVLALIALRFGWLEKLQKKG